GIRARRVRRGLPAQDEASRDRVDRPCRPAGRVRVPGVLRPERLADGVGRQSQHLRHADHHRGGARRLCDVFHSIDPAGAYGRTAVGARRHAGGHGSMLSYLGLPAQASSHAGDIDGMLVLVHWLMALLFVGWGVFFVYVLFRFRRGSNPVASYTGAKGKIAKSSEIAVAIVEVILLVAYAIPAWATRVKAFPSESEALVVRVVGEQLAWNVQYHGQDGKFGRTDPKLVSAENPLGLDKSDPAAKDDVTTINQLNVPVGRPVLVHLSTKDVIHSFGLYEMRVKQDAIPGMDTPVWFIPTVTTDDMRQRLNKPDFDYEITCSQLCGLGHFRMRGFVTVQSAADFTKWFDEQLKEKQQ